MERKLTPARRSTALHQRRWDRGAAATRPSGFFWNGEAVATQHIKVLVTEGWESGEVFFPHLGASGAEAIQSRIDVVRPSSFPGAIQLKVE